MIIDLFMRALTFFNLRAASTAIHVLVLNLLKYECDSTKHWVNYGLSRTPLVACSAAALLLSSNVS
jgi:hypothetical protein